MAPLIPFLRQHWKFVAGAALFVLVALMAVSVTVPQGAPPADYGGALAAAPGLRAMSAPAPTMAAEGEAPIASGERKVITSGSVRLEVSNASTALDNLTALAARHQGFIGATSRRLSSSGVPSGSVTLRVPNASFPAALLEVRRLGRVLSESVHGEDITEQFVDLGARLNNAKAHEKRLLALLDRAQNVSEVLAVERELGRIRGDIESMQGQLNFLANRAALATLTVEVTEPVPLTPAAPGQSAFDTAKAAIEGFLAMAGALVVAGATLLPLALAVWVGWKIYRKRWAPPGTPK